MPIFDRVTRYSVSVLRSSLHDITRQIRLDLESGGTASISFTEALPDDFLRFSGSATSLFMTADQFDDAYRVLRGESPVFFNALDLFGIRVGNLHGDLDLDAVEASGEGDKDPRSLEALIRIAHRVGSDRA